MHTRTNTKELREFALAVLDSHAKVAEKVLKLLDEHDSPGGKTVRRIYDAPNHAGQIPQHDEPEANSISRTKEAKMTRVAPNPRYKRRTNS